jgi:hypothetical protein
VARLITSQDIGEFLASANKSIGRDRLDITSIVSDIENDVLNLSSFVDEKFNKITLSEFTDNIIFTQEDSGKMRYYNGIVNISAFITPDINTAGYTTTVAQLSTGTITIMLSSSYSNGRIVAYGDLLETAGVGATANISRIYDNNYLITGLLQ